MNQTITAPRPQDDKMRNEVRRAVGYLDRGMNKEAHGVLRKLLNERKDK